MFGVGEYGSSHGILRKGHGHDDSRENRRQDEMMASRRPYTILCVGFATALGRQLMTARIILTWRPHGTKADRPRMYY
jgi:hypothetical protein